MKLAETNGSNLEKHSEIRLAHKFHFQDLEIKIRHHGMAMMKLQAENYDFGRKQDAWKVKKSILKGKVELLGASTLKYDELGKSMDMWDKVIPGLARHIENLSVECCELEIVYSEQKQLAHASNQEFNAMIDLLWHLVNNPKQEFMI